MTKSQNDEVKRAFHWLSRAWYGASNLADSDTVDEITIGNYSEEGGTTGEFNITWVSLGGKIVPQLKAFDDSWRTLTEFNDLLLVLAQYDDENPTQEIIAKELVALGFEDSTRTEYPYKSAPKCLKCGQDLPERMK